MSDIPNQKRRRAKERPGPYRWAVQVFFLAICLSAALSLASEVSLGGAGAAAAGLVLAVEGKWDRRLWKALALYWLFLLSWIPITFGSFVKKTTVWEEIRHTRATIPEALTR